MASISTRPDLNAETPGFRANKPIYEAQAHRPHYEASAHGLNRRHPPDVVSELDRRGERGRFPCEQTQRRARVGREQAPALHIESV